VRGFKLLDLRNDGSLAIGLVIGAAVVFQQPLRFVLNAASAVEQQYHLDLLPALVVLSFVFMFHQHRKWQASRAAALAAETAARIEHERAVELDELVVFGRSLANALELRQIELALWRDLPDSLRNCRLSLVMRQRSGWRVLVQDSDGSLEHGSLMEEVATDAARQFEPYAGGPVVPVATRGFLCFPVFANRELTGAALLVDDADTRSPRLQRTLAPVLAFMGIAMRNVQLLTTSREDSVRDSLTRWFNRRHAIEALNLELRRAARSGNLPALLMFDLDGFKAINDHDGHLHGDAVLEAVARTVEGLLRGTDVKCRYGGDEFLVILPETPAAGAAQVAENIRQAIASLGLATIARGNLTMTCSIGVTVAAGGESEPERLIARADAALYQAKREGRNRVVVDDRSNGRDGQSREGQKGLLALGA